MDWNRRHFFSHTSLLSLQCLIACKTRTSSLAGVESELTVDGTKIIRKKWVEGSKAEHQEKFVQAISWLQANDGKTAKTAAEIDPKDPKTYLSYENIVAIHENSCTHGSRNLLPWHRLYMYYFEAACQIALDDPTFGVPYWDWTETPHIPKEFLDPQSLLYKERTMNPVEGKAVPEFSPEITGVDLINKLLLVDEFESFHGKIRLTGPIMWGPNAFNGRFETGPHNNVHNKVGGLMANATKSPGDPLFWLHHSNVDRVWATWQNLHPELVTYDKEEEKRYNSGLPFHPVGEKGAINSEINTWKTVTCVMALDKGDATPADGYATPIPADEKTHGSPNQLDNASLAYFKNLGYTFDSLPIRPVQTSIKLVRIPAVRQFKTILGKTRTVEQGSLKTEFNPQDFGEKLEQFEKNPRARLRVNLENLPFPKDEAVRRALILRVFLLAGEKKTLDGAAKDAFATVEYLGNFSFFASPDHHAKNEGASLLSGDFDASDSYHNQGNSGRGASLTVLVVPYNMDTGKVEGGFFDASGATVTLSVGLPK